MLISPIQQSDSVTNTHTHTHTHTRTCRSVTKLYLTLCDPMYYTTPGFSVLHCLPKLAQTHVHWVGVAIQPSHPLSSASPPAFFSASVFPSIKVFSNKLALSIRWPKCWSFCFSISSSSEYDLSQDVEYSCPCWTIGPCCLSILHVIVCIY